MLSNLSLPQHHDELHVDRRERPRVLLVAPPSAARDEDESALQAEGFAVELAESCASAVATVREQDCDAVVIDVAIADMSPFELCRQLKRDAAGLLPVLHLAPASSATEMRAQGSESGADAFLARPYDATTLRAVVSTLVRIKREDVERQANAAATSLLQQALDTLPNHLAMLSATGEILAVNRAWEAFALDNGYRDGGTGFGTNYLDICAAAAGAGSDEARAAAEGIRNVLAGRADDFILDYACHSPDEQRWFRMSARRAAGAGSVAAIVTHTESTAEHRRLATDARFRGFVETTGEGVIAMDNAGAITYANPPMLQLLGIKPDERPPRTLLEFMDEEARHALEARLARRAGHLAGVQVRLRRHDGELLDLLSTESAIRDEAGNVVGLLAILTDVTERMRAERTLAESLQAADLDRRRLRATLNALPVGVGFADVDGRFERMNDAVDRIWGGRAPGPRGGPDQYRAWWPGTDVQLGPADWPLARTLATGAPITGQMLRIERFDGTIGHVLNSTAPIHDAEGALVGAVFVLVDISDRESAAEERIRLLAELDVERGRLAAVFDQAPAFLAVVRGPNHVFERTNPTYQQLIGHRDVVGKPLLEALPELVGQGFIEILDAVRASGVPFRGSEVPVHIARHVGGPLETRYLDFVYQPLRDSTDDEAIVVHGVDVTARVLATRELQRAQELLREQFAKMPVPTALWERRGDDFALLDFNDAAAQSLGFFTRENIGKLRGELFQAGDNMLEELRRALREDVVLHVKAEREPDEAHGRRSFELTFGPQQPDRVLVHAVDTTARIRLEAQLQQARKLDALGRLAGGIAHDFNNILGVMMGYTSALLEDIAPDDPIAQDLGEVQHAIERGAALTAQLLAFGRERPLQPRLVDLRTVLRESERLLARVLGEDVTLTLDLDGPSPLLVMVDVIHLEQVVINLAVNARDAMPKGGTLVIAVAHATVDEAKAEEHGVAPGPYVRLSVRDTGTGMDERTRQHMFDPFFTTKEVGKGTGLGLATVHGIVAQSGGYIEVDTTPGEGATFHVLFPEASAALEHPTPAFGTAAVGSPRRSAAVLLVEDEEALRHVTARLLRKHGYDVMAAGSPAEALEMVEAGAAFDCLITDVVMPGMSGQELAARVRERRGAVPVLLLSGYARDAIDRRGTVDADMPLLHKPVKLPDLLHAIDALLDPAAARA